MATLTRHYTSIAMTSSTANHLATRVAIKYGITPATATRNGDDFPISGDALVQHAEPFTPSAGNLWSAPGVSAR